MTWVLVLYIYAGTFAKGDSVTLTTIEGFSSKATCIEAGKQSEALVSNSAKEVRYVCVAKK
jgi:hypothetical protein